MIKILFLQGYSTSTARIQFAEETKAIQDRLYSHSQRPRVEFYRAPGMRIEDLRNSLSEIRPNIVHICGHGSPDRKIYLQTTNGENVLPEPNVLGEVFALLKGGLSCVVINGSVNPSQTDELYKVIGCVVGLPKTLGERFSIQFSAGFYKSLQDGLSFEEAFKLASHEINIEMLERSNWPLLLLSPDRDERANYLARRKGFNTARSSTPVSFSALDFGAPAAERDIGKGLKEYFVESDTFRRVYSGEKFIILGNRGSGKSAIFKIIAEREKTSRKVVIELSPEDYSYEMLSTVLKAERAGGWAKYGAYAAAWKYLIYILVMKALVKGGSQFKRGADAKIYKYLRDNHKGFQGNPIALLISYLKRMEGFKIGSYEATVKSQELAKLYDLEEINQLLPSLKEACIKQNVIVLIDELDRGWDASEDAKAFVAGLFQAVVSINELTPDLRVLVSLRMELYDSIPSLYEDAQKYRDVMEVISWDDSALLQLVGKRVRHTVPGLTLKSDIECWNSVFLEKLDYRQARSFNYVVDRTLYRPREIILFCSIALEESRKTQLWPIDYRVISKSELAYSEDRTRDIVAEYRFQYSGLMSVFDVFRGRSYGMTRRELEDICLAITTGDYKTARTASWVEGQDPEYLIDVLWRIGFLRAQAVGGLRGVRRGGSAYIGPHQVFHLNLQNIPRFQVHPMFRAFLGMKVPRR